MKARKKLLWSVVLCASVLGFLGWQFLLSGSIPDPRLEGIPLSTHLQRVYFTPDLIPWLDFTKFNAEQRERDFSREALARAGPEALPMLMHWLASEPPPWQQTIAYHLRKMDIHLPALVKQRRTVALKFLAEFRVTNMPPALFLLLASCLTNGNRSDLQHAAYALSRGFRNGTSAERETALRLLMPLRDKLTHSPDDTTFAFDNSLRDVDGAINTLDPGRMLRPLLTLEFGPVPARVGAARELREKPRQPDRAIPLLMTNLASTNASVQEQCALALARYGPLASNALSAVSNLLSHPRQRVRSAAASAQAAISQ